jgi:aryl-alcohol dehydrogenase-like predicted oxidoreductase
MKYKELANTGVFVSQLCFGAMTFGGNGFWNVIGESDQKEADAIVNRCLEAGINFFDTANIYSFGQSEIILGKALGDKRQDIVLATKVRGQMGEGPNQVGLSKVHIMNEVHDSLKRLNTDYIDLYQIHGFDPLTKMEDTLRTLDNLVQSGKVRYIGCSNLAAWQLMKFLGISELKNLESFVTLQAYYSIAGRDLERELVPLLKDQGMGLMVWSPLAGGFLTGKFTRDKQGNETSRRAKFDFPPIDKERAYDVVEVMQEVAEARGVSVAQIALAWLLHQDVVTSVIIGAKRMEQLEDNLKSVEVELTTEELDKLNKVSELPPEYPGWMLARQMMGRRPGEAQF